MVNYITYYNTAWIYSYTYDLLSYGNTKNQITKINTTSFDLNLWDYYFYTLYDEINNVIITKKVCIFNYADILFHNATNLKQIGIIPKVWTGGVPLINN